jgi:uncharacterized protein with PIN domain
MKCTYCRYCLNIVRYEEVENDYCENFYICYLCGRVYYSNQFQAVEVPDEIGDKVRGMFRLRKVGRDDYSS